MSLKYQQVDNGFVCLDKDSQVGQVIWLKEGNVLDIIKTQVDSDYSGNGIAYHLIELCLNYALDNDYKIKATCSYVKKLFDTKIKEYQYLLIKGVD